MRKEGREEEEEGTRRERERERNPTSSFCSHSASNQALSLAILCSYTPPPYSADPCPYSCEEKKKEKMIAKGEGEGGGKKGEGWFFFRFFFFFLASKRRIFQHKRVSRSKFDIELAKLQAATKARTLHLVFT